MPRASILYQVVKEVPKLARISPPIRFVRGMVQKSHTCKYCVGRMRSGTARKHYAVELAT